MASDLFEPPAPLQEPAVEGVGGGAPEPAHRARRPALARCTAVPFDRFAGEIWGRQASLSRAAELPRGFDDLFGLSVADDLLARQGLRTPFLRVAKDGTTLPASRYTTGGGVGATIGDQASSAGLARLFADGSSIVLQALHRTHGPIIDFAAALAADLGHPAQVNAYLTPPQSQGFSDHYDVHDVFVLQVHGEKRWRIHAPVHPAPLRNQPWTDRRSAVEAAARTEPLIDEVLRPGDALYLPRGYLHAATALGDTSVHLTVGVHMWTRRHLLEQILTALDDDEELRASLPLGLDVTDPAALAPELERTIAALTARLPSVQPRTVADGMVQQVFSSSKGSPVAPLAQATAVSRLSADDRVRWRPSLPSSVRPGDGAELVVRTPDGSARVPREAGDALDRLRRGETLAVAEFPGGLDLARELLRACLIVAV